MSGEELEHKQAQDVKCLESKFKDTLTKEPVLTTLVSFCKDTGDQEPIFQRAYSTPAALRESID